MRARWLALCLLACALNAEAAPKNRIQLVVLVTVDQMGTLYLTKWGSLLDGGIARLQKRGAYYPAMRFATGNTETAPGHATIATGSWPNVHGMVANYWYDAETFKRVNCVDDPKYGRSPVQLRAPTLADALALASDGKSRTVSVALKDRSAIILAGETPRAAVWFDRAAGMFVSGKWRDGLAVPKWMEEVNAAKNPATAFGSTWDRLRKDLSYDALAGPDADPSETDLAALGTTFPHKLGVRLDAPNSDYNESYQATPQALDALMDLAKRAIADEELGRRGTVDFLAIGISNLDYAGHYFGPRSHEALDMLLRIDRAIGELIDTVDREVGSGSTLWIITADHGATITPEDAQHFGVRSERVDPRKIAAKIEEALAKVDGKKPPVAKVLDINPPRLYLSYSPPQVDRLPYQRAAAAVLRGMPEFVEARAVPDLDQMPEPFRTLYRRVSVPGRNPDVMVVQRANDIIDYIPGDAPHGFGSGHGSPYLYDASVPVIIAGPGISKSEDVTPWPMTRLAPTIAALIGIDPPGAAFDRPLPLVENQR